MEIALLLIVYDMCSSWLALLIRNSEQAANLDCHCSCLLASILQWRLQNEAAGAYCVVTLSIQETLRDLHAYSRSILESAVACQLGLLLLQPVKDAGIL